MLIGKPAKVSTAGPVPPSDRLPPRRIRQKTEAQTSSSRSAGRTTLAGWLMAASAHPPVLSREKDKKLIARDHSFSPHPCKRTCTSRDARAFTHLPCRPPLISARRMYSTDVYTAGPEIEYADCGVRVPRRT